MPSKLVGVWKRRSCVSLSIISPVTVGPRRFRSPSLLQIAHRLTTADRFHVHIVNANHTSLLGMTVGQAHMLDDIISLVGDSTPSVLHTSLTRSFFPQQLELDGPNDPSIFQRMTLSYGLGEQHSLFAPMKAAQLDDAKV